MKNNITILNVEYPLLNDNNNDHVFTTVLAVMFQDFNTNPKYDTSLTMDKRQVINIFSDIQTQLMRYEHEQDDSLVSRTILKYDINNRISILFEELFYQTEHRVIVNIAPLKCLSDKEKESLEMVNHFQRFNKTTQEKREESIDELLS